jgi:acyl carrier protein
MTVLENLGKFLVNEVAADLGKTALSPDEDLLEQGIIDSLGIMKLVVFIEETFDIQIADEDIVPDNFQSLSAIARFVEQTKTGQTDQ